MLSCRTDNSLLRQVVRCYSLDAASSPSYQAKPNIKKIMPPPPSCSVQNVKARKHVGSIMVNMSFHVFMSCHVVMSSCERLTLVCVHVNFHPPMSKTRIPASVQSVNFKLPSPHLSDVSVSSKSGSKTPKFRPHF